MGNSNGKPVVFTDEVNLNHFRLLRVVGKGAFGKVRIVERKDSGLTFALKYIRKDEGNLTSYSATSHGKLLTGVVQLYIVVDLMNGGDLRFHISRKTFTEDAVRFWMGELGCALRYIHKQGIVHRDLKPDNVLLDSEGHVHLADFNVASDFKPGKLLYSKSGTLAYLAPEVFEGSGYLNEVDWWSLGVTFYECIYSKRPFDGRSHEQLSENIKAGSPRYYVTSPPVSMPCLHALTSLLEKDRKKRIGANGFDSFTQVPFFSVLDFEALEQKQIPPIFVPSADKTNFDATYDLEELLLEEAPLEARARRQKPRAELKDDATQKEIREDELHRMIETMFEPFDYTTVSYDHHAGAAIAGCVPEEHVETTLTTSSGHSQPRDTISSGGSPPLPPVKSPARAPPQSEHYGPVDENVTNPNPQPETAQHTLPPATTSFSRPLPPQRPKIQNRKTSKGGGVQMVLDETGSWSDLADQSATIPEGYEGSARGKKTGMLGFLGRKAGRDRSPKPQEPGVLGKEGARQIIS
ncbi:putative protein kinase [Phaeomoniella chlamydospora]|uniref:Protein kinase domain-containing protein n=1 Tax=Phaeomoniella chlamydospora TaxID=158046 RepID=A0A0G2GA68_PHACM|nr:putative protein kinase [Phaeomoniella chlamydospora]